MYGVYVHMLFSHQMYMRMCLWLKVDSGTKYRVVQTENISEYFTLCDRFSAFPHHNAEPLQDIFASFMYPSMYTVQSKVHAVTIYSTLSIIHIGALDKVLSMEFLSSNVRISRFIFLALAATDDNIINRTDPQRAKFN